MYINWVVPDELSIIDTYLLHIKTKKNNETKNLLLVQDGMAVTWVYT